jgi:hypothetical protein
LKVECAEAVLLWLLTATRPHLVDSGGRIFGVASIGTPLSLGVSIGRRPGLSVAPGAGYLAVDEEGAWPGEWTPHLVATT